MIDLVHDVAGAYRKLVDASSYPGDIYNIKEYVVNNEITVPFYDETLIFVHMLLDAETTFCVLGDAREEASKLIARLTYSKPVEVKKADFIFMLSSATEADKKKAVTEAKVGNLIDPHASASLVIEMDSVAKGDTFTISGPGIEDEKQVNLNLYDNWLKDRQKKNKEYPLGIEMYFIDKNGDLLVMPRTTRVKGCE